MGGWVGWGQACRLGRPDPETSDRWCRVDGSGPGPRRGLLVVT